jgi:hypothetical protein
MYYKINYADKGVPEKFGAVTRAWFITIRPKYMKDIGLEQHELCHVRSFWQTLGLHCILYKVSKTYRLCMEVKAYKEQLCWPPAITDIIRHKQIYAGFIATKYDLEIREEEAVKLLG